MKFRASYFNICGTMVRENMRRFWPIPAIGFLIYFLSGVFPILMNYNDPDPLAGYIGMSLSNQQPFFMAAHLFLPIIAAVSVFRYLHGASSVSVMHAMPFTRSALFGSNFLSGLLLSLSPVFANGIILLLIAKPVYQQQYGVYNGSASASVETMVNVFSRLAVCRWMWESFVLILFIFAVAVFAGIVTGNGLMHFMMALSFQFLVPVLYITVLFYFRQYLFGFTASGAVMEFFLKLSPYLQVFDARSAIISAAYLAVTAVIIGLSLYLYRKRELERAGDALVFPFMQPIICYLITFFAMTLFGLYFSMLEESDFYRYAGYIAGTLVGFLIGRMIVKKTVRIFNADSLKSFAIYCTIAILFFGGLNFDITGYERRVPEDSNIVSVTLSQGLISKTGYDYTAEGSSDNENNTFTTADNIEIVRWLHQQLLHDRKSYEKADELLSFDHVSFTYRLRNGSTLSRSYSVPTALLRSYGQLAPLFESAAYQKRPLIADIPAKDFNYLNISTDNYTDKDGRYVQNTVSDKESIYALAQALSKDLTSRTFQNMSMKAIPLCTLELGFSRTKKETNLSGARTHQTAALEMNQTAAGVFAERSTITVYPDFKNTIAWLKENGFASYTSLLSDRAVYMKISYQNGESSEAADGKMTEAVTDQSDTFSTSDGDKIPVSDKDNMVITDKDKMAAILDVCETVPLNYGDCWVVTIAYPSTDRAPYDTYDQQTYFINREKAPQEILDYFK